MQATPARLRATQTEFAAAPAHSNPRQLAQVIITTLGG